jgi:uncharacterized protein (UPF0212 family)
MEEFIGKPNNEETRNAIVKAMMNKLQEELREATQDMLLFGETRCQVCGEPVQSVYGNATTGKFGHKRCI